MLASSLRGLALLSLVGLCFVSFVPWATGDDPPPVRIDGTWKVVKLGGEELQEGAWDWTFAANRYSTEWKEGSEVRFQGQGSFKLDTTATPNRIILNMTRENDRDVENVYYGAFKIEGDILVLKHSIRANTDPPKYPEDLDPKPGWQVYEMTR